MRKYALTKLGPGDYLCPGNDALTIYRFRQYEDGPCGGLMDWPRDRIVWGVESTPADSWDGPDDSPWRNVSGPHMTRRDALAAVFGTDD